MIRRPTADDVADLARIHVQAWAESYGTLLPPSEHAARSEAVRQTQWRNQITTDTAIAYAPTKGFAQSGPQRDARLAALGYTHELYAIYILDSAKGTGLGRALFDAVRPTAPFTALVIADNQPARRFYDKTGAQLLEVRDDRIGETPIKEAVMAWGAPA